MEKIIYHGQDITDAIVRKEKKIVELYAKKRKISFYNAMKIYLRSTLRDAIRDVENDLWTQSEYYFLEAYISYLDEAAMRMPANKIKKRLSQKKEIPHYNNKKNINSTQTVSVELPYATKVKKQRIVMSRFAIGSNEKK